MENKNKSDIKRELYLIVIGALIASVCGFSSSYFLQRQSQSIENNTRKKEKLEELYLLVYQLHKWENNQMKSTILIEEDDNSTIDEDRMDRISMLVHLYHPRFKREYNSLVDKKELFRTALFNYYSLTYKNEKN